MSELFRPVKPRAIGEPLAPAAAPEPAASGQDNATWVKSAGSPSYSARPISSTMAPAAPAPLQPQIRSIAPGTAASPSSVAFRNPGAPEVAPLMRPAGDDSLKQAQGYYAREAKAASSAREAEIEAAQQAQAQQIDANNYEVSRRAARENRETVVNPTTGAKEFAFTDAEEAAKAAEKAQAEAEKAQQAKRNDSRERRFRQQGREFYTDSQGNIRPVDNREKFEADQAEAAKVKATKARNEETQSQLATESQLYEIDKESRPVHEKPDELKKEAGAAVDEAIYTALAAKDLDKATRARLQALADKAMERGEPMNRADLPDDLATAVGKHAPDQWSAAEERAAALATDQENRAWRAARESEIEKLRLKSINPAKWEARYGGKELRNSGIEELRQEGGTPGKKPDPEPLNTLTPEMPPLPEREASYRQRAGLHAEKVRVFNESQEAQARQWDNLLAENDAMVKTGVTADQLVPMTLGDEERLIHRDIVPRLQKLTERFIERGERDDAEVAGIEADANELRREAADLDRARELENREKDAQFNQYLDKLTTDPDLAPAATRYRDASADYEARRAAVEEDLTLTPEQKKVAHLAIEGDRKAQFEAAQSEVEAGNAVKRKRIEGHSKLLELADNAMHAADGFEILFDGDKPSGDKPALTPETRAKLYERQVEIIGQIAQESGISPVEAARAVRSYQDAATEWSPGENIRKLSNGKMMVNPALTWDNERFAAAVEASGADEETKAATIASQAELKKLAVDPVIDGLRKTKSFSDYEEKQMMRPAGQRPRTEVEMVDRYMAERGKTQAFIDNADMIIRQGGNDVVAQFYGFGYGFGRNVLHLGKDWSEKYRPVLEDLGDPGGTFNAANADMSAALNAAQVPQLVQDVGRAAISMAPALAAGGVGAALRPVITSALIRGSTAGTIGRTFLGNMVGRGGFSAITAREAAQMASQAGLGGAGAGAFMQTFGSTYPEAVRAYQDSGMSFDEAADAAFLPAAGSATFTAAITMAFGKTGVESLLRGRAAGDVTAGELAAFLAKPGHRGQFLKAIKSKEFNEMAAKLAGTAGKDILGEAAEEGPDQLYSALVKLGTYEQDPDKTVSDAIGEGFHAALIGGILGGGAAGVQMAASDARRALSALSKQAPNGTTAGQVPAPVSSTPGQPSTPTTPSAQPSTPTPAPNAPAVAPVAPTTGQASPNAQPSTSAAPGAQPSTSPPAGTTSGAGPAPEATPARQPLPEQVAVSDAEIDAYSSQGRAGEQAKQQARTMRRVALGEAEQLSSTELGLLGLARGKTGKIGPRPLSKLEQDLGATSFAAMEGDNVVLTTEGLDYLAARFPQTRKMVQMDEPQARAYFRDKAAQAKAPATKAPTEAPAVPTIEDELEGAGFPKGEPIITPAPAVTEDERRAAREQDLATWAEKERGLDAPTAKRLAADHVARKGVTDPSWMIQALQDFGPEVNDAKAKAETKPETSAQPATQTGPTETKPETKQEPASQTAPREKPPIVPADNRTAVEKLQAAFAAAVKRFAALGVDNIVEIDPEFSPDPKDTIWVNQNNGRIEYNPARVEAIYGNRTNAAAELEQTIKHEFWHLATIQALIAKYGNLAKANEAMANVWTQFTKAYPQAAADIERVYEKGAFEKDPARGGWELSRMVMEFREDGTTTEMVTGAANSSRRARLQKVFQEHFSERGGFKISKALRSLLEAITEFISGLPSVTRELRELSDAAAAIVKDGVVPVGTETQGAPRAGQVWEAKKSGKRYRIKEVTKDGQVWGTLESAPTSTTATSLGTAQGMVKNGRLVTVLKPAPRKSGKSGSDYDHHTTPLLNQLRETPIRSIAYFNGQRLNLFNRKRHGQPLNPAQKKTIQQINDYNDIPKVADYEGPMKPYLQGIFSMEGLPVDEVVSAMDRAGLIGTGDGTSKASDLGEAIHAEMKSLEARVVPIPATADQWTRRELNAKREMQDAGMWDWFEMVIDQVKFDWQISAMEELDEKTGQPTGKTEKGTAISKLLRRTAADLNEGDNIVVDKEELTVTKISDNGIVSLSNGKSGPSRFYETIITIEPGQVIYVSAHVDENGEAKVTGQGSGATLKAGNPGQEGRFEAEQFELIDTPLSGPDAVAARKAEMDRMKIRAMQQRRLQGDDLVTQEDAFIDTRNEAGGQGLLFASNPSGIGQQFFDFGISGELSDNPNQLAFSFADTAKLAPEEPVSDAEAAADPASAPDSIPAKVELPAEAAPSPSLFPGDSGDLFARAGTDEIADFGEKIGGARKDTARPLGPNQGKSRAKDTTPVWRRNIVVLEHRGRFQIFKDTGGGAVRPVSFTRFETEAEAEAAIPVEVAGSRHVIAPARSGEGFAIYRKISQQKRVPVRADFTTRQEAIDYLAEHPIEIIEHRFDFPEKPHLDWIDRTAPTTERANERGEDEHISPARFQEVFGFRAGEFGNWNMGTDGQAALDYAYDALLDLAGALNIPPRAISLNGELAVAFGARGTGGKNAGAAHYETDYRVINLTKINGAGSLAHEWYHALDHYFFNLSRQKGNEDGFVSRNVPGPHMRPEMKAAFRTLQDVMTAKKVDEAVVIPERMVTGSQTHLEEHLDGLRRRMVDPLELQYNKRYKAPTGEQLRQWDEAVARHIADPGPGFYKDADKPMKGLPSVFWKTYPELETLAGIYKAVLNRTFLKKSPNGYAPEAIGLTKRMIDTRERVSQAASGATEQRTRPTDYFSNAKFIDRFRVSDYWSTPHEMAARAFEAFVSDRLTAEGRQSPYLVNGVRDANPTPAQLADDSGMFMFPYPYQADRKAINAAFDRVFETMETKPTEKGQMLFASNPNQLSFDFGTSGTLGGKNEIDLDFSIPAGQTTSNGVKPTSKSSAPDGSDDLMRWAGEQAARHPGAVPLPAIESDAGGNDGLTSREIQREAVAALVRIARDGLIEPGDREALKAGFKDSRRVANIIPELVDGTTTWDIVGAKVTTPEEFFALNAVLRNPYFESVRVAVLDDNNLVVHAEVLNIGTINESIVDLSRIARMMGIAKAKGVTTPQVVMSHNHPGGDPSPSSHDRQLQSRLEDMVERLGGTVLDHVITNGTRGYTLRGDHEFTMPEESQVPWVHFERTKMPQMSGPDSVLAIAKSLRAMNPDARYLVLLDNRFKLIGIEQLPEGTPSEVGAAATISATSIGANRVMILDPKHLPGIREIKKALNAANVEFVDSLYIKEDGEYFSARESGLMEPSESYNLKAANPDTSVPPSTLNSQPSTSTSPLLRTIAAMPAKPRAFVTALLAGDTVADAAKTAGYTTTDPQALAAGIGRRLLSQLAQQGVTAEQAREMVESEMGGGSQNVGLTPQDESGNTVPINSDSSASGENIAPGSQADIEARENILTDEEKQRSRQIPLSGSIGFKGRVPSKVFRGESKSSGTNAFAYGKGLYSTTDRGQAAVYGDVRELDVKQAIPENPLYFPSENAFEQWWSHVRYDALKLRRASEFEPKYGSDIAKVLREIFPSIDGLQIGSGRGAYFVKYPQISNESLAPESSPGVIFASTPPSLPTLSLADGRVLQGPGEFKLRAAIPGTQQPIAVDPRTKEIVPNPLYEQAEPSLYPRREGIMSALEAAYSPNETRAERLRNAMMDRKRRESEWVKKHDKGGVFLTAPEYIAAAPHNTGEYVIERAAVISPTPRKSGGWRRTGFHRITGPGYQYTDFKDGDWVPIAHDEHKDLAAAYEAVPGDKSAMRFTAKPLFAAIPDAYHGTPHKIDPQEGFRTDKIGTGEGAQAYGHGLYFAESDKTARGYRDGLSQRKVVYSGKFGSDSFPLSGDVGVLHETPKAVFGVANGIRSRLKNGQEFSSDMAEEIIASQKKRLDDEINEKQRGLEQYRKTGSSPLVIQAGNTKPIEDAIKYLQTARGELDRISASDFAYESGNLYTVRLKPDDEEMLDWDKPLGQQSEQVQKAMKSLYSEKEQKRQAEWKKPDWAIDREEDRTVSWWDSTTGSTAYTLLHNREGGAEKASRLLAGAKIKGIRYRDANTRFSVPQKRWHISPKKPGIFSVTDGINGPEMGEFISHEEAEAWVFAQPDSQKPTYNYVIFDEADIEIIAENGKPVTMASALRASTPPSLNASTPPARAPGETLFDAAINRVTSTIAATDTVANLKDYLAAQYAKPFARPVHRFVDFLLKQAIPLQRLPQEVNALMQEMAIKQSFAQQKAMDVIRSVSGKAKFSDLAWPAKYVNDKGMRKRLFLAMQGKLAMSSLPPEVQAIATQLRARLNKAAIDAVRQGRMHPDTYRDMEQTYMPHYYYDHEKAAAGSLFARLKLGLGDMMAQRSTMWRIEDFETKDPFTGEDGALIAWDDKGKKVRFKNKQHRDAFYTDFLKERTVDEIHRRGKVAAFSAATKSQIDKLTAADLNRPDQLTDELRGYAKRVEQEMKARYHKGDPLTEEEQEQAGLIYDPVYAIAKHLATMEHDNATAEFFNTLATMPGYLGDEGVAGFTKLPDNRKLGRLAGKYVRDDVSEEVLALVNAPSDLARFYDGMLALWKTGKALALDTPIPTPSGWTTMGDLKAGDVIFDEEGKPCEVLMATGVQMNRTCYRVEFSDGTSIVADAEHLWATNAHGSRETKVVNTETIRDTLHYGTKKWNTHSITNTLPIETPEADLPIPPYVFGVWLGDGNCRHPQITVGEQDRDETIANIERDYGVFCGIPKVDTRTGAYTVRLFTDRCRTRKDSVQAKMIRMGVLGKEQKFIPDIYLRASIAQRTALLQGLMDSDGTISKTGGLELTTSYPPLRAGIMELLRSLGFKPSGNVKKTSAKDSFRIRFHTDTGAPPFRLARKAARLRATEPEKRARSNSRQITAVVPVESVPVKCIQVSSPNKLYLAGEGMIPTHNTVYNPGTHVRNVMGNLLFAQMAGVNPATNAKYFREGIKILLKGGPLLEELYQEGVLGGDFLTAELRQDLAAMLPEMTTEPGDDVWFKLAATVDRIVHRTGAKQAKRLIEAAYTMEDEMFKVAAYLKAKATGMTSKEAAAHTRKWFPYYDQIGTSSAIRALRRGPMPFFSFQREALRILANAAKERPASLAFALAAPAILSAISAALLGLDDDDEKDIWKTAMRGKGKFFGRNTPMFSILLPNRSTEGRLQQFDLTNVMPFASLLGSRMEIDNGTPAWQQWALELITSSPITGIPLEMAFNTDTFSNRPIWEENMTPGEKRGAAAKYVWSQLMPPLAPGGTGWNMAANAGTRVSNKSLERRNAGQAWLRAVVGIDVRNASPNLYAMAEQFRTEEGLDQPDFAGYGTTPESRARARLFGELVQDAPSIDTLAKDLAFLKKQGRPIETEQDLNRLLFYRNPIMVIDGEDNQRKFRRSLSPEARAVLAEAESEFKRIQRTSGPILRRASVKARSLNP